MCFSKSTVTASIMWNKWSCPVDNIKQARENVCMVYTVYLHSNILLICTFRTVSMSIFGFLCWTRTADKGPILFGKVFALVISGKLLCRWGWLFRWLWKWKQGEGRVLYTWTFLCTHKKNCPLKLAQVYRRYTYAAVNTTVTLQQNVNAFAVQQMGSGLMKGRAMGSM